MSDIDNIYTSKTHILTSWILAIFGLIAMLLGFFFNSLQLVFSLNSIPSFHFSVGFTLILFTVLLPIIFLIFGLHGLWKAGKIKLVSWILIILGVIIIFLVLFHMVVFMYIIVLYTYASVWLSLLFIFSLSCFLIGLRELSKIKNLNNKFTQTNYEI